MRLRTLRACMRACASKKGKNGNEEEERKVKRQ